MCYYGIDSECLTVRVFVKSHETVRFIESSPQVKCFILGLIVCACVCVPGPGPGGPGPRQGGSGLGLGWQGTCCGSAPVTQSIVRGSWALDHKDHCKTDRKG